MPASTVGEGPLTNLPDVMNRKANLGFFAVALGASLATSACSSNAKPRPLTMQEMVAADPLPLAVGAKWTYKVNVQRYDAEKDVISAVDLDWTTEVIDAKETNGVTAFTVRGWPTDLTDFDTVPTPTERVILRSDNSFLWTDAKEPGLDSAEGWFTWPLVDGQKICPSAALTYCWQVSAIEIGYSLLFYTGPDEVTYDLSPGTGVSRFRYSHHGTTNTVEAKLVSYKKGSGKKPTP